MQPNTWQCKSLDPPRLLRAFKENTLQHFASAVDPNYSEVSIFLVWESLNKLGHAFTVILNAFLVPLKSMCLHTTSTSLMASV